MAKLAWGIMGTGNIAKSFAKGLADSKSGTLVAVGSRSQASADTFAKLFPGITAHATYEALLADHQVQAVYISMPHTLHAEWAIKACEAGKHVLCEKPIGLNHAEAMAIVEAAQRHGVFLMEAFMYRCHPQTAKLVELIRDKVIGEVQLIQATFAFRTGAGPEHRLINPELGGGGILDVGCYPVSLARLVAGAAVGKPFAEPIDVKAVGVLGASGVDEWSAAVLSFPGNIVAQIATGVRLRHDNLVRITGSEGTISIPSLWIPAREGGKVSITVHRQGKDPEEIVIETKDWLYGLEADTVARHAAERQAPAMSWDDSLGNMRTLDRWRESIGLTYDLEKPERASPPYSGRALAVRAGSRMPTGRIAGLAKPVSRLVMGVDNQVTWPHTAAMFDDFFERGGNAFDVAWVYGGGRCERMLGAWVKNRALRDQVVILGKGAHTPFCTPKDLTRQLHESLERLAMDHLDIYMMHRDNLEVPVGEFVDVLNEHLKAGRMRAFGGSNWSIARIDAANAYAKAKGLTGFAAWSNNFSLARMVDAPWNGCFSASDAASRAWLTRTQMPLMPWSSQARGFFTERADPADTSDQELVRCWYAPDNWQRRERVVQLAQKKGVLPINIALAYVLCQPFPTFPLIGPRTLAETRTTWPALDVTLTPGELAWLNLEAAAVG